MKPEPIGSTTAANMALTGLIYLSRTSVLGPDLRYGCMIFLNAA
jgi:hypothetical protein